MNGWEKLKTTTGLIAAVLVPITLAYIGNIYSSAIKQREIEGSFVEIAVGILQSTPDPNTKELREWAIQVVDRYSGVPMSNTVKKDLIETNPLPKAPTEQSAFPSQRNAYIALSPSEEPVELEINFGLAQLIRFAVRLIDPETGDISEALEGSNNKRTPNRIVLGKSIDLIGKNIRWLAIIELVSPDMNTYNLSLLVRQGNKVVQELRFRVRGRSGIPSTQNGTIEFTEGEGAL